MKKFWSLAAVLTLISAETLPEATAALVASESFNYTGTTIDGQSGGTGWADAWSLTINAPNGHTFNSATSLAYISGVTAVSSGGRITNMSNESASRTLVTGIDTSVDQTVWMSLLIRKNETGQTTFGFRNSDGTDRFYFIVTNQETLIAGNGQTADNLSTTAVVSKTDTMLVVVKLTLSAAGTDSISVKLYSDGDTLSEPTVFDVTKGAINYSSIFSQLYIQGSATAVETDEIRIGTTYADVVPVPEPATAALSCAGAIAALGLLRRRQ